MLRIWVGAVLIVAGIAGFIEAGSHSPYRRLVITGQVGPSTATQTTGGGGLSQTAYDVLRTGSWALLIVGSITLVVGLMAVALRPTFRASRWWVGSGAVLAVAAFVAFTEAHNHRPSPLAFFNQGVLGAPSRLSQTAYDLLRIGGWALLIAGVVLILVWLIAFWRQASSPPA